MNNGKDIHSLSQIRRSAVAIGGQEENWLKKFSVTL
jgi:hypothetical protein